MHRIIFNINSNVYTIIFSNKIFRNIWCYYTNKYVFWNIIRIFINLYIDEYIWRLIDVNNLVYSFWFSFNNFNKSNLINNVYLSIWYSKILNNKWNGKINKIIVKIHLQIIIYWLNTLKFKNRIFKSRKHKK